MSVTIVFISFLLVYLLHYFVKKLLIWSKLPPGPWGVPFLGSVPFLGAKYPYYKMEAWRKKYGEIFTISLFHKEIVILNDWELVRDYFGRLEVSGRPDNLIVRQITSGNMGIISAQGSLWQENRRFTMRILKDFGFGKREAMDSMIQDSAIGLCQHLKENQRRPQDLGPRLNLAVLNIIWKMTADKQFSHDDARMQDFMNRLKEVLSDSGIVGNFQWVPLFVYLWPPALRASRLIDHNMAAIAKIFSNELKEHQKSLASSGQPKDFIDSYLTEMAQQKERGEINPNFSEFELRVIISDLFIAGSETTANTIRWCVLFLLCHPEIQEKLQAEVDNVVGPDRLPSLNDRDRLPYTQAFIMEVQRLANLVPFGVPHVATEDVEIGGYFFPKGTAFMANLYSCHMNPKFWPDPEKFDPGRFLNPDGSLRTKVPSFLPFVLGKRQCLGESLALMELILFVTIFMQKFTFRTTTGRLHPKAEAVGDFIVNPPKPFQFIVEERKH
ncbi:unnamed protein product [Darwinula stevensoni]|uniref:Cytochrome P450 n=1 Tax=Darwinula stevensoni TaxID=69355 RepID=A0A7R8ZXV3_9CRUS|nr:unnamed protein product [Darwinula stevensoni]CAG0879152.1 unnamed protein product [Darwinula stevensoni]